MKYLLFIAMLAPTLVWAQINIVRNGSFEGDFIQTVPLDGEDLYQNPPPEWEEYKLTNSDDDEAWLTDSIFRWININLPNTPYNNAYYSLGCEFTPLDSTAANSPMPASVGRFFVGFSNSNDGTREGVQQDLGCKLNSGDYTLQFDWARPYVCNGAGFKVHLSEQKDSRRKEVSTINSNSNNTQPGVWYFHTEDFNLDLNDQQDMDNRWLVFTGDLTGGNNLSRYIYLDNVNLFRWCDAQRRCIPTTGQICPIITAHLAPLDPLTIIGMENVSQLHVRVYNNLAQTIVDTIHRNPNGIPPYRLSRLSLPANIASAAYHYEVELTNDCGAMREEGTIIVQDTALYNLTPPWTDSTANWSPTPIPCCLDSLTLQNLTLRGNVSYIVRNQITVQNGVSLAPGSNVILQAGNVVEIDSAEFDGSVSSLEILEIPCPLRCAQGQDCDGGSATIDVGGFVVPTLDSAAWAQSLQKSAPIPGKANWEAGFNTETEVTDSPRLTVSPNPVLESTTIGIYLPAPETVTLSILDLQQKEVRSLLKDQPLSQGRHACHAPLQAMPPGLYLIQLRTARSMYHIRLIKQ